MSKRQNKSQRKRISIYEFMSKYPTEFDAMEYFEQKRWGETGRECPHCADTNTKDASHKTMPYWCGKCRKYFSVKTGTALQSSNLPYRKWLMAIYILSISIKGVSSLRLANDLNIKQEHAWHLLHRLREGFKNDVTLTGEVEVDEAYIGGKDKNKHESKKPHLGGSVGKSPVVGMKSRSGKVSAKQVGWVDKDTLHKAVTDNVELGSVVYTDQHKGYRGLSSKYQHSVVKHSDGEYVKYVGSNAIHTNGIESFWALLKRGLYGTFHQVSGKHLQRYVTEFASRSNVRRLDTQIQIDTLTSGLFGRVLPYRELTA